MLVDTRLTNALVCPKESPSKPNLPVNALSTHDSVQFSGGNNALENDKFINRFFNDLKNLWTQFKDLVSNFFKKLFDANKQTPENTTSDSFSTSLSNPKHSSVNSSDSNDVKIEITEPDINQKVEQPMENKNTSSNGIPSRNENLLHADLQKAERMFNRRNNSSSTAGERASNSIHYGADVFKAVFRNLDKSQLKENTLKDVEHIVNELNSIAFETSRVEKFSDLRDATQNKIIDLLAFSLKHSEPAISSSGKELAESLGITSKTIEALQKE